MMGERLKNVEHIGAIAHTLQRLFLLVIPITGSIGGSLGVVGVISALLDCQLRE